MPVVLVELGPFIVAALAALLAIAADYLVRVIGNGLGVIKVDVSIVHFSYDLGAKFISVADGILSGAVDDGRTLFVHLANWFIGHSYIVSSVAASTVSAIEHVGDQIAHIVNTAIPNAEANVSNYILTWALGAINELHTAVDNTIGNAITNTEAFAKAQAGDALATAVQDIATLRSYVDQQVAAAEKTAADLNRALTNDIGNALTGVASAAWENMGNGVDTITQDIAGALTSAETFAKTKAADALNTAESDIGAVKTTLSTAIGAVGGAVAELTNTVATDLTTAETFATTKAGDVLSAAETDITAAKNTLSTAIGAVGGSVAELGQTVAGDLTAAEQFAVDQANAAKNAAEGVAGAAIGALTGTVDSIGGTVNADALALPGTIAATIALSLAPALARITKLEECSVGTCDDSPNKFSDLLSTALGFAGFAEGADFIVDAIRDPAGTGEQVAATAEQWYSTVSGVTTDVSGVLDALLSL